MIPTLKRAWMAALVVAVAGVAPLSGVPQKCYWVCDEGVSCDQQCDWGDGEITTCGEFGICRCDIDWNRSYYGEYGQHCRQTWDGSWSGWYAIPLHLEYVDDCAPASDPCSEDWTGSASYDSEEACCAAEGCYGPSC